MILFFLFHFHRTMTIIMFILHIVGIYVKLFFFVFNSKNVKDETNATVFLMFLSGMCDISNYSEKLTYFLCVSYQRLIQCSIVFGVILYGFWMNFLNVFQFFWVIPKEEIFWLSTSIVKVSLIEITCFKNKNNLF